tara:strand:+ start:303 stop:1367 length:1065 start_codon:yes stop_codon:yes gene_type:complete
MELQNFINTNSEYIQLFKDNNFRIKRNKNLIIVKNNYNDELKSDTEDDYWKMYCRGAIIDTNKNKVICLPPVKSIACDIDEIQFDNPEVQYLIDGTMINLFYTNNQWTISTRSEIGGYNKWNSKKSFREMFNDCVNFDMKILNKNYSYSFVMRHVDNRNISPITLNELYLVEIYSYTYKKIRRLPVSEYPDILKVHNITDLSKIVELDDYYFKGYTIKQGNKRYKLVNKNFEKIENINTNSNTDILCYFELRKNGNLKEYLKHYPEKSDKFNIYRNQLHDMTNELYSEYKNVFIQKNKDKKNIEYYLKPLIYDLHKLYLKDKKPITWNDMKNFMYNLEPKRIIFALNYKKNNTR